MAKIIVVGDIVWDGQVGRGGHTMHLLQWLVGLERLKHQVLFLDCIGGSQVAPQGGTIRAFDEVIRQWWHADQTALLDGDEPLYGLDRAQLSRFAGEAAALITIGAPGCRRPLGWVEKVRPRILIEQDPGYTHLWALAGAPVDIFGEQDFYFTVGGNIGSPRCALPTLGINWRGIWNPVVAEWWPDHAAVTRDRFTTVADWYSQNYLEFEGQVLGPKAEEFRKFIDLPQLAGETLEIVLAISPEDPDIPYLQQHGWRLEDPGLVSSPGLYHDYLAGSLAEFSCAKGGYAGTRCGWFSDRSACYLAAGRPVVLQSTGFADLLPTGKGLFSVATAEEAKEAICAVRKDYAQHSAAARAIALEHFEAGRILSRMLAEAGIDRLKTSPP